MNQQAIETKTQLKQKRLESKTNEEKSEVKTYMLQIQSSQKHGSALIQGEVKKPDRY